VYNVQILKKSFSTIFTSILLVSLVLPTAFANTNTANNISLLEGEAAANTAPVRVIVQVKPDSVDLNKDISALGGKVTDEWDFINALLVEIPENQLNKLASLPGVFAVKHDAEAVDLSGERTRDTVDYSDERFKNVYNYAVGVQRVWEHRITGKGITVAVVDSGIYPGEGSDFGNRLVANVKFNGDVNPRGDSFGHGTHVAGIIGGNGANSQREYIGIAPHANLISVRFTDNQGRGYESNLISSLEWIYQNHEKYNIRVVNISSGVGTKQSYKESGVSAAAELLWHKGIVVVASAGNKGGERCSTCYAPANDPFVITVGAVDDNNTRTLEDDYMKSWSSIGKTLDGHYKPDIVAPGSEIVSYMPTGTLRSQKEDNIIHHKYFKMGGTSMSAPIVSGIVALMLEVHPEWTPDQVKWVLQHTTRSYGLVDRDTNLSHQDSYVPGMVAADKAVFYTGTPRNANQGLHLNPFIIDPLTGTIFSNKMSWANMSWANMSWANMSWANGFDK
jgi:serine protease AprX